ncbi:MAG: TolC family protein, partial [Odoribacteraceae bacterium]|nr:TolC family protein [Odoribacteraceae bacterium]
MKTPLLLLPLLLAAVPSVAQQPYTLQACRDSALARNRAITVARTLEDKARHEQRAARARFLPGISAGATFLYTNARIRRDVAPTFLPAYLPDPVTGQLVPDLLLAPGGQPVVGPDGNPLFNRYAYFPGTTLDVNPNGTYLAAVTARQPLFAGGKILTAYRLARVAGRVAEISKRLKAIDVVVETDEAFWNHVKAIETAKVAAAFQQLVDELARDVQRAGDAGMKTRNDRLKIQVQVNKAALQLEKSANATRLSRENLCRVTGLPLSTRLVIAHSLDDDDDIDDDLPPATSAPRPEHDLLDEQVKARQQHVHLARADYLPRVGIEANYGRARGPALNGVPLVDRPFFSALLSVQVPLFHWGEGANKARAARDEQQAAEWERDDLAGKMEIEARHARDRLSEARLEVAMNKLALEQASENLRVARERHAAGMESLAACLEAQTLWQQASLALVESRIALKLCKTYYLKATGNLSPSLPDAPANAASR